MNTIDKIKREIARIELLNDMSEGMTEPTSAATLTAALNEIERLREALLWIASQRTGGMIQRKAIEALEESVHNAPAKGRD